MGNMRITLGLISLTILLLGGCSTPPSSSKVSTSTSKDLLIIEHDYRYDSLLLALSNSTTDGFIYDTLPSEYISATTPRFTRDFHVSCLLFAKKELDKKLTDFSELSEDTCTILIGYKVESNNNQFLSLVRLCYMECPSFARGFSAFSTGYNFIQIGTETYSIKLREDSLTVNYIKSEIFKKIDPECRNSSEHSEENQFPSIWDIYFSNKRLYIHKPYSADGCDSPIEITLKQGILEFTQVEL